MSVAQDWKTIRLAGKNIWTIAKKPLLIEWGFFQSNPDRVVIVCPASLPESQYEQVRNFGIQIRDTLAAYSTSWTVRITWPIQPPPLPFAAVPNQDPPPPPIIIPPLPRTTPPTSNDRTYYV